MMYEEQRLRIEREERNSEYFIPDYPSGLFCDGCMTELTRHEAEDNMDTFNYTYCIDCWESRPDE